MATGGAGARRYRGIVEVVQAMTSGLSAPCHAMPTSGQQKLVRKLLSYPLLQKNMTSYIALICLCEEESLIFPALKHIFQLSVPMFFKDAHLSGHV
jgi:hypothetical protein